MDFKWDLGTKTFIKLSLGLFVWDKVRVKDEIWGSLGLVHAIVQTFPYNQP